MLALAADGAESNWPGRVGKLLLLFAGLVALLDLAGPEKLSGWKRKANRRRAVARRHRDRLDCVRPLLKLAKRMAVTAAESIWQKKMRNLHQESRGIRRLGVEAVLRPYGRALNESASASATVDVKHLTGAQLEEFVARARDALRSRAGARSILEDQSSIAINLEPRAIDFLIGAIKEEKPRVSLEWFKADLYRGASRDQRTAVILLSAFMPVALLLSLTLPVPGFNGVMVFFGAYFFYGTLAMTVSAGLMNPTVKVSLKLTVAIIWFRLAWLAWILIGKDRGGRPLRISALVLFIVGSLLDLATSWDH